MTANDAEHAAPSARQRTRRQSARWFFLVQSVAYPVGIVVLPWYLPFHLLWILAEFVLSLLALRLLGRYTGTKLARAQRKGQRSPAHDVAPNEIRAFEKRITAASDRFTPQQLRLFAVSMLNPADFRRRLTDQCETKQRVIEHRVCIEFDLDPTLGPLALPSTDQGSYAEAVGALSNNATVRESDQGQSSSVKFLAIMIARKGELHDNCKLADGDGRALPALSYREYRVLMGLTLRSLLKSAFKGQGIPSEVIELEQTYFELLLQHGVITDKHGAGSSNRRTTKARIADAVARLESLKHKTEYSSDSADIDMIVRLVRIVAENYAIVAALPSNTPNRFFTTYEYTELPSLEYKKSLRQQLRLLLGARPVFLRLSAANAMTCQSYHLVVSAPDDLYVGDFEAPCVADGQIPTDSRVDYHRVRGRRGQHYFHLYSRIGRDRATDPSLLNVDVKFFEVPPGTVGRAAISALACALTCIGVSVATTHAIAEVDSNIAGILLTLPSIAAVWLGFEGRQSRLLEGTLTARLSLVATFMTSLAAGVLLMMQKSGFVNDNAGGPPSVFWLILSGFAAINAAMTCGTYWERVNHYREISRRPAEQSSVILAN